MPTILLRSSFVIAFQSGLLSALYNDADLRMLII